MANEKLTDYERQRLENIRRNEEMMAALKVHHKSHELSTAPKRRRTEKSYKLNPEKKPRTEAPIVIRRSRRQQGIPPDFSESDGRTIDDLVESTVKSWTSPVEPSPSNIGPISMSDAYRGKGSGKALSETIVGILKDVQSDTAKVVPQNGSHSCEVTGQVVRNNCCLDLEALRLEPENVARIMPGRIMTAMFLPTIDVTMIVAGDKFGNVAFWKADAAETEGNGIHLYHPHSGPVSGISTQAFSVKKIFTSCYNGFVRLLDAEREVFDVVYSSEEAIFSLSQQPNVPRCLYFSEGREAALNVWDERTGKLSASYILHDDRINTIDFDPENVNIMATSSTDGTARIWDLRSINAHRPRALKMVEHKKAVHSAFFSPSGRYIATTSIDDTVGMLSGTDYEDLSMIPHNNKTGRWISSFRGIWGWDDSYVFIGNMKRGVDVLSPTRRKTIMTLQSEHMSAIPCRFAVHPSKVGMLAGATSGGQVYMWTSS